MNRALVVGIGDYGRLNRPLPGCANDLAGWRTLLASTLGISGTCTAFNYPNAAGGIGAACATDATCKSGNCVLNPLTGLGYCSDACFGGDTDCGNGTVCRPVVVNGRDPAITTDDLKVGFCTKVGIGAPCGFDLACKACTADSQCNVAQGVTCVAGSPPSIGAPA